MTPKQAAKASLGMHDFCANADNQQAIKAHKSGSMNIPEHFILTEEAAAIFSNKMAAIKNAQNSWDARQWTEYDIERQRQANTQWYQWAVKDGRITA